MGMISRNPLHLSWLSPWCASSRVSPDFAEDTQDLKWHLVTITLVLKTAIGENSDPDEIESDYI